MLALQSDEVILTDCLAHFSLFPAKKIVDMREFNNVLLGVNDV